MSNKKMQTHKTEKLIDILEKKNIQFNIEKNNEKTLFKKYSYYQVINAYKNLFITDIDTIHDIKKNIYDGNILKIEAYKNEFNIKNYTDADSFFEEVCTSICDKYGLYADNLSEKLKIINKISFHQHVYDNKPLYRDFVRMYKFEHELRLMLLKYVLIIEESIKNIFIGYLNDNNKSADYLVNMKNYNTSSINNKAFDTMQLIIKKHNNKNSKPIKKKREQELTIPYWILINELTMNETYNTILNLNYNDSISIFARLTSFFTGMDISISIDKKGFIKISEKEKKLVKTFGSILSYLGNFRNMLAHNQPIYFYNIESYKINGKKELTYEVPIIKKDRIDKCIKELKENDQKKIDEGLEVTLKSDSEYRQEAKIIQQYNINANLMRDLVTFFGEDNFNKKNQERNLNLSIIIYIISKILNQIDKNNKFYEEITSVYKKFSIILISEEKYINDIQLLEEHLQLIDDVEVGKDGLKNIIKKIDSGLAYKRELSKLISQYDDYVNRIKKSRKRISIKNNDMKYKPLKEYKRYMQFTGITRDFFSILKDK